MIDRAHRDRLAPDTIFCSFGDMLRVPGSKDDLLKVKARGGDVRIVYSPLDALRLARQHPDRKVVFFAVGFRDDRPRERDGRPPREGGGPHQLLRPRRSRARPARPGGAPLRGGSRDPGPPRSRPRLRGHGYRDYEPVAAKHRIPIVVTGFEPLDLLRGVLAAVEQLERGEARVENQYLAPSCGTAPGRPADDRGRLRGVGPQLAGAGGDPEERVRASPRYAAHDAEAVFDVSGLTVKEPEECRAGLVLQGRLRPPTVRSSAPGARRSTRSGRRWCPPRVLRSLLPLPPLSAGGGAVAMARSIESMLGCPAPSTTGTSWSSPTAAGGGRRPASSKTLFAPAFRNPYLEPLGDGAIIAVAASASPSPPTPSW